MYLCMHVGTYVWMRIYIHAYLCVCAQNTMHRCYFKLNSEWVWLNKVLKTLLQYIGIHCTIITRHDPMSSTSVCILEFLGPNLSLWHNVLRFSLALVPTGKVWDRTIFVHHHIIWQWKRIWKTHPHQVYGCQ
jgi:hypothetical protein